MTLPGLLQDPVLYNRRLHRGSVVISIKAHQYNSNKITCFKVPGLLLIQ